MRESCERSNDDWWFLCPMVRGSSYVYSLLCWSWTGKHCVESLEEKVGFNDTLNHNLSRLNDTVIPRNTCTLHFPTHRSRRNQYEKFMKIIGGAEGKKLLYGIEL